MSGKFTDMELISVTEIEAETPVHLSETCSKLTQPGG